MRTKKSLVTDGSFSINKNNQLIYKLNEPLTWRKKYNLPNKISFIGNWKLNRNCDLELFLDETKDQFKGNSLVIKGEIISVDQDRLTFEIKNYDREGLLHIQLIQLSGTWQANEYNQISFLVKKKTLPDILTLVGIWQLNQNQQVAHTYEKTDLKTKSKISHTITFEGFWQINHKDRLTYILTNSVNSYFEFRVQLESPNLYPQEGVIKYRIGIGLKENRTFKTQVVFLYGAWKFSRKLGLIFQIDYGQGYIKNIEFGTNLYLTKKDKIIFALTNKRKEPLGIYITFTHRFLKQLDAEAFLRLKKIKEESSIEGGIRIPF
jgi:hypothetical protein